MTGKLCCSLLACALAALPLASAEVTFRVTGAEVLEGGTTRVEVLLDTTTSIYGWSYGLCFDPVYLQVTGTETLPDAAVVKNGQPPDWALTDVCETGVSHGVIVDLMVGVALPARTGFRDLAVTFQAAKLADTDPDVVTTAVRPCHEEACSPPIRAVWTDGGGLSTVATLSPADVIVHKKIVVFNYYPRRAVRIPVDAETGTPLGAVAAPIMLKEQAIAGIPGVPAANVRAFNMGFTFDPAVVAVLGMVPGTDLAGLNGGAGPDFFDAQVGEGCAFVGCQLSSVPPYVVIQCRTMGREVVRIDLGVPPDVYVGGEPPVQTTLDFADTCGTPAVANTVAIETEEVGVRDLGLYPVRVTVDPVTRTPFMRGDANADGRLDIGDAIWLINGLFRGGAQGDCRLANDVNGDRSVDVSDVIYAIGYVIRHSNPQPPAPFPACGLLADQEALDCVSYPPCAE